ncbi:metal ion transporters (Cu(2+), Fe(2+), etc.), transport facilitation [Thermogutta terrifontis]|uniref:Metal ion transporters (Cu(2+), Fe(2+), etc.), transport facilitation n=1 Tax=Thermogutta terrifontis TaxID=1331910 RepID=A0A286RD42_9BACT|nr:biopolymer transporter ExbD [Thermogutta terrifontis]ASV73885.1 metal ion transporters (Cu(2+), Fe(2+), etc.), transport facilitation [Thermogutta terrifontis]
MSTDVWTRVVGEESEAIVFRRPRQESVDFDITPMIDVTFLLLIFFLVASSMDVGRALELPPARHGKGASPAQATIITVAYQGDNASPAVYLADGKVGTPLPDDPQQQREQIVAAVREGVLSGKRDVIVKAERKLRHKDVARILEDIGEVQGVRIYIGVLEKD